MAHDEGYGGRGRRWLGHEIEGMEDDWSGRVRRIEGEGRRGGVEGAVEDDGDRVEYLV